MCSARLCGALCGLLISMLLLTGCVDRPFVAAEPVRVERDERPGWVPVDCTDRLGEVRAMRAASGRLEDGTAPWTPESFEAAFGERVLAARPGDDLWLPAPYPETAAEMATDVPSLYGDTVGDIPRDDRGLMGRIARGELAVEIHRVESWTPSRCLRERPARFHRLLRFFDPETGAELVRAAQSQAGQTGQLARDDPENESRRSRWLDLDDVPAVLEELGWPLDPAGDEISDLQYVEIWGLPVQCNPLGPCVAFRSGESVYLLARWHWAGGAGNALLWEVSSDAPRESISVQRERTRGELRLLGHHEVREPSVTLGFEWAEARLVAGEVGE